MTASSPHQLAPDHDARFGAARDGVCVVSPEWKIRYANASLLEILRLLGSGQGIETLWDALPDWKNTPEAEQLIGAMELRQPAHFRVDPARAGDRVWEVDAEPLPTGELRLRLHNATHQVLGRPAAAPVLTEAVALAGFGMALVEAGSWTLLEANPAALALLDPSRGTALGRRLPDLIRGWQESGLEARLAAVAATGEPWEEAELKWPAGRREPRWFRTSVRRLEPNGGSVRLLVTGCEVTREARARHEVEEAAARASLRALQAETNSQATTQSLAALGHELRTPINALEGYAALLADGVYGPVTEGQAHALARMRASQRQLLALIDRVLDAARLEAGARRVHPAELDAAELVAGVVEGLRGVAERKGLSLEMDAPTPLPLRTDAGLVRQILTNLVGNALKFTEQGAVRVSARAGEGGVEIDVQDTGPGISPEHLEHIWEPFFQAEPAVARREGGTGLGLALSREYARLLEGELRAQSEPGQGSTFRLFLPSLTTPA